MKPYSTVALELCLLGLFIQHADAQQPDITQLEEIVVTSRKMSEDIQDVPDSVTVHTGEYLLQNGIGDFEDLADATPSLFFTADTATRPAVSIRGIGATQNPSIALGVGVVIDGVYEPGFDVFQTPFLDIEQIEVLRGPQGTLYGKNTLAGAINITTKRPTNEFSGKVTGSISNGDSYGTSLSVSGPLIEDELFFRAAISYRNSDGFYKSIAPSLSDDRLDRSDATSFRGKLLYTPSDNLEFDFGIKYSDVDLASFAYGYIDNASDFSPSFEGAPSSNKTEIIGGWGKITFNTDSLTVASITSFTRSETYGFTDADITPASLLELEATDTRESFSQEIRVTSDRTESNLRWLAAFFYNREVRDRDRVLYIFGGVSNDTLTEDSSDTFAAYGQAIWDINEDWSLTLGLRYNRDDTKQTTSDTSGLISVPTGRFNEVFESVEPKVSLSYHISNDVMAYGTVAKGTRSGGFNNATVPPEDQAFDLETAWTYEIGFKSLLWDNRLRLNAAAFLIENKDLISDASVNGNNISSNIGDGEILGFELEALASLTDRLKVSANLTYLDSELTEVLPTARFVDLSVEDRFPLAAEYRFNGNITYTMPVNDGLDLRFSGDIIAVGKYAHDTFGNEAPTSERFNLSAALLADKWEIIAFVDNVSDEKYFEYVLDQSAVPFFTNPVGFLADPRTYGLRLSYSF